MTIAEAIAIIDAIKPNSYTVAEKVAWLSSLDGRIKNEVLDRYEDETEFEEYSASDTSTELLVPAPYDRIYEYYMAGEIDRCNGEITLYNNDAALFNSAFSGFRNYYNTVHTYKGRKIRII